MGSHEQRAADRRICSVVKLLELPRKVMTTSLSACATLLTLTPHQPGTDGHDVPEYGRTKDIVCSLMPRMWNRIHPS